MTVRAFIFLFRRLFAALILSMISTTIALNVAKFYGVSSTEYDAATVYAVKIGGTFAAAAVAFACLLCLFRFDIFREIFLNDRFYLGAGGSVMKPRTFSAWIKSGGDLVFHGEIYYNSILIRPATGQNKNLFNDEKSRHFKETANEGTRR